MDGGSDEQEHRKQPAGDSTSNTKWAVYMVNLNPFLSEYMMTVMWSNEKT